MQMRVLQLCFVVAIFLIHEDEAGGTSFLQQDIDVVYPDGTV